MAQVEKNTEKETFFFRIQKKVVNSNTYVLLREKPDEVPQRTSLARYTNLRFYGKIRLNYHGVPIAG